MRYFTRAHFPANRAILTIHITDSSEAPDSSDGPPSQGGLYVTTCCLDRGAGRKIASRHASPHSTDHHSSSSSSSSDSSPVHSLGLDAPDQAHSGSSTRDVSPRLSYPPRRAPRCSEAFRHWIISSYYRKLILIHHLRKRFRDSYSSEASIRRMPRDYNNGVEAFTPNTWRYAEGRSDEDKAVLTYRDAVRELFTITCLRFCVDSCRIETRTEQLEPIQFDS
ncbi:hypothetical protein Tco_0232796 [Tanacetum coccineum]